MPIKQDKWSLSNIISSETYEGGSGITTGGLDGALHQGPQAQGPLEPDQQTMN